MPSICFYIDAAPWISAPDSFIQYSKRLNVHLISCFSSSFSKISYKRSLWDSFLSSLTLQKEIMLLAVSAALRDVHEWERRCEVECLGDTKGESQMKLKLFKSSLARFMHKFVFVGCVWYADRCCPMDCLRDPSRHLSTLPFPPSKGFSK